MKDTELYENVIARPLVLRHRTQRRRRPRDREELMRLLRAESPRLLELALERGFLPPEVQEPAGKEADLPPSTELTADGGAGRDGRNADVPEKSLGAVDGDRSAELGGASAEEAPDADDVVARDMRTDAEKRFDEIAQKRERERLRAIAALSNKAQIERFNEKLAKQPEHFDLFKVSHTK